MKANINRIKLSSFLSLIIFVYVVSGSLYSVEWAKPLVLGVFGVFLVLNLIFLSRALLKGSVLIYNRSLFFLFFISFILMLISSVLNGYLDLFFGILNLLFLFLIFFLNKFNKKIYEIFDFPIKILFVFFTFLNFLWGFSIPFQGVFQNPNSLGGLYATIAIIAGGVYVDKYKDIKYSDLFLFLIVAFSVIFSLFSNSRMSFALSVLVFFAMIFARFGLFLSFNKNRIYFNFKKMSIFLGVLLGVLVFIKINYDYIEEIFLHKLLYKLDNDNFSAGRNEIWAVIWENRLWFGHGRDSPHLDSFELAAHNTFMSILDQFGVLSALSFFTACLMFLFLCVKPKVIKLYGILPLFITGGFLLMSISESMINKTIMFCMLVILNFKSFLFLGKNK